MDVEVVEMLLLYYDVVYLFFALGDFVEVGVGGVDERDGL